MHADGFETLAIHAGQEPDPVTGAVVPPIYQVSTYKQDGVGGLRGAALGAGQGGRGEGGGGEGGGGGGKGAGRPARWMEGHEYSRTADPPPGPLAGCLAALAGGARALALAA